MTKLEYCTTAPVQESQLFLKPNYPTVSSIARYLKRILSLSRWAWAGRSQQMQVDVVKLRRKERSFLPDDELPVPTIVPGILASHNLFLPSKECLVWRMLSFQGSSQVVALYPDDGNAACTMTLLWRPCVQQGWRMTVQPRMKTVGEGLSVTRYV